MNVVNNLLENLFNRLRTCASCEYTFLESKREGWSGCPKCGFAHYSTMYVYNSRWIAIREWIFKRIWRERNG